MDISRELEIAVRNVKNAYTTFQGANDTMRVIASIDYSHLIGKQAKVYGHKAWNIGTIIEIRPRIDPILGDFFLTLLIKGANGEVLYEEPNTCEILD